MEAIVLTYDANRPYTQLMIESYREFWPNHPFTFRVPYNEEPPEWDYDEVEFIQTGIHYKDTINGLLEGIDDDEFIYWANDDRYLMKPVGKALNEIVEFVNVAPEWLDIVKTTAHEGRGQGQFMFTLSGIDFYKQVDYMDRGFWMHHFMRAKVLKKRFSYNLKDGYPLMAVTAKLIATQPQESALIPERAVLSFAEPMRRGKITINAIAGMRRYGIEEPEFDEVLKRIMYDDQGRKM